jgi:hypothetical protein
MSGDLKSVSTTKTFTCILIVLPPIFHLDHPKMLLGFRGHGFRGQDFVARRDRDFELQRDRKSISSVWPQNFGSI